MRGLVLKSAALLCLATIFNACEEEEASVSVTGVTVTSVEVSTDVGEEVQFMATIEPSGATNASITWSTSDASIATINEDGLLTAIGSGEVEVIATTVDGDFTSSVIASVNATLLGTAWTGISATKSGCELAEDNGTETCGTDCQVIEFETDGTITFTGGDMPSGPINYTKTDTEITVSYEDEGETRTESISYVIELDELLLTFGSDEGGCSRVEVYIGN